MDNGIDSPKIKPVLDPKAAVSSEIAAVEAREEHASLLRKAVDFVTQPYHHESSVLADLQKASKQLQAQPDANSAQSRAISEQAIGESQASSQKEADAYNIVAGAVKTGSTFLPGKTGYFVSGAMYALDATNFKEMNARDMTVGFAEGMMMRGAVSKITKGGGNPALMSLKLGVVDRLIDSSMSKTPWVDAKSGDMTLASFGSGLLNVGKTTFDPVSLATDVGTAGLAAGVIKIAPKALAGNTFRSMATVAFTRGYAGGLADEARTEYHSGELSPERLALYPIAVGLSSTLVAAPGIQRAQVRNWAVENGGTIRDLDYKLVSISPSDVKAIASNGGRPVETTVKPVGESFATGEPETVAIAKAKVPVDWISAAVNSLKIGGKTSGEDQIRFLSRPQGDESAPWNMVTSKGNGTVTQLMAKESNFFQRSEFKPLLTNFAEPAIRFLGSGSETGAFQLANGAVLKLSSGTGSKLSDWGDLPFDSKAMFKPLKISVSNSGRNYGDQQSMLLQEPLKTPVSEAQAAQLRQDMATAKISFWDYNYHLMDDQVSSAVEQAGVDANGKVVMLDYGARRPYYKYEPAKPAAEAATATDATVTPAKNIN